MPATGVQHHKRCAIFLSTGRHGCALLMVKSSGSSTLQTKWHNLLPTGVFRKVFFGIDPRFKADKFEVSDLSVCNGHIIQGCKRK